MLNKLQDILDSEIQDRSWSQPYTEADLEEMYWYGVFNTVKQMKEKCIGYPIGNVITPALTERDLDAILRELEGESNEEAGS